MIYRVAASDANSPLKQGELLTNVVQPRLDLATIHDEKPKFDNVIHPFAIILTQDCDLDQDFKAHLGTNQPDKQIPSVIFAQVYLAEELRGTTGMNSTIWPSVRQNKHERYQFLQKIDPSFDAFHEGLPELAIDFKKYFTIARDEIYLRIKMGIAKRRCVLMSPYLGHLSSRFAFYLSRVALPEEHFSEPVQAKAPQPLPNKSG